MCAAEPETTAKRSRASEEGADADRPSPPLIEIQDATVYQGSTRVFDRFTLSIARGENTAILGPNGAGKTTLLKLITRELYPVRRAGSLVRVLGRERWNVFDLRRHLGLVSHELQMRYQRQISGLEVVLSGYYSSIGIHRHQSFTPAQRGHASRVLEELGAGHLAGQRIDSMSAGEQRRCLLGRALVNDPHTLLLDEPTTSLDLRATFELLGLLRRLVSAGKTLILVTHRLDEIPPEIARVVLLERGTILADGETAKVLTADTLGRLFGVELEVVERGGYYRVLPSS